MRTTMKIVPLNELPIPDLYQCHIATLCEADGVDNGSNMREVMTEARKFPERYDFVDTIIMRGTGDRFVGWSLVFAQKKATKINAFFYIHNQYRREGYGTKLYKKVDRHYDDLRVHPWDDRSTGFFTAIKAI